MSRALQLTNGMWMRKRRAILLNPWVISSSHYLWFERSSSQTLCVIGLIQQALLKLGLPLSTDGGFGL